jgi:aerobic C4-dicarboxylate transport protein
VATWTKELDRDKLTAALSGSDPFDEDTMLDPHDLEEPGEAQESATKAVRHGAAAEEPNMALASRG